MSNTSSSSESIMVPPRLLGGAAMLFWGAMTGEVIVSLFIAILMEAKNWVKWSWDFDDAAYVKAFQVSLGLLGFVLFIVWMGEVDYNSLNNVMKWFPVCLLPIELAQRYGRREYMNMNTFFYFARQRMKQDLKEGKPVDPNIFNTGYPYIFIIIVVSSCTNRMDTFALIAMLALLIAIMASVIVRRGLGWKRMLWAVPLMLAALLWIQAESAGLFKSIESKFRRADAAIEGGTTISRTQLGNLGEVKQTQEIQWRMWGDKVPEYVRLNVYNQSNLDGWSYDFLSEQFEDIDQAFESGAGIQIRNDEELSFIFDNSHINLIKQESEDRTYVRVRGAGTSSDSEESVVPSMPGFYAISELHGDEVRAAVHPLGVLKLVERKAVIDYRLWYDGLNRLDRSPNAKDVQIAERLRPVVKKLSDEIGLGKYESGKEKVAAIGAFFAKNFKYSLSEKNRTIDRRGEQIAHFMSKESGGRTGHCEYFATAAALLLREQGIHTRYCVGYAVKEKSGDTWIMRGTHAHAWCSAWINGVWQTVDLTPPDWLNTENDSQNVSWSRGLKDWFENIKQDFLMWRTDEENKEMMNNVMWALAIILLLWVVFRLYRARQIDQGSSEKSDVYDYDISSDLLYFEGELQESIGERAKSQTYYKWVLAGEGKIDNQLYSNLRELVSMHEESRFGGKNKVKQMASISKNIKSLLNK